MVTPMSPSSSISDPGLSAAKPRAVSRAAPQPRRYTGPVLMGDIHPAIGGRPLLLMLWERWEEAARDG